MMILFLFGILFLLVIIVAIFRFKIRIDIPSFIKKGFSARRGIYGVYCFCGKQGSGKTFSTVNFLLKNKNKRIYSNISLKGINYTHIHTFEEMLKIAEKDCIIVWDEIFTALSKSSRINPDVMSFLSQQRKREVIFITTAQEWMEIPMTLRRYVRYQIDCSIFNLLPFSILIERYRDGENMKWDQLENEYIAPIIATKISKMSKKITQLYDTFEVIGNAGHADSVGVGGSRLRPRTTRFKTASHFAGSGR